MRTRGLLQNLVFLAVGAAGGYLYATQGRKIRGGGMVPGLPDAAGDLPTRFQRYYQTHTYEVIVGAVLVGVIVYLLTNRKKGGGSRRR